MLIGQTIGPFKVEKELGSGAMGTVYRATFSKNDGKARRVAIKVIAPGLGDNERIQARFTREADILKQLKHPNIVRLLASGKFQGRPFYAMEFIEGHSLDHYLATKGRLHWEKMIEMGKQICASLQHAHDHGIIHRDLKPSNLMLDKAGNLKLTDFGIAKDSDMSGLTSANSTVGTAAYMSPEQCRGERDLTPKSDLYALGIVFYELLTGRKPFAAENAMDMFIQHVSGTFERPARIVMDIPPWLDTLV
jgi:eukaryotic-like serine/threonine-protein kinase